MSNYNSNYEIAQAISERIGAEPIPFDSVYEICLQIYNELGGEPGQFDSVYEILLSILNIVGGGIASKVIDDHLIATDKTWSSNKINSELSSKQDTLIAGDNVTISDNTISVTIPNVIDDSTTSNNKTWSSNKVAAELANAGFSVQIVQELPVSGDTHTIYFVPETGGETGDAYDEYMYIDNTWEKVGSTRIDLSEYAKKLDYFIPLNMQTKEIDWTVLNSAVNGVYRVAIGIEMSGQRMIMQQGVMTNVLTGNKRTQTIVVTPLDPSAQGSPLQVHYRVTNTSGTQWYDYDYNIGIINDGVLYNPSTATDKVYSRAKVDDLLNNKQDVLTAGTGISISGDTISCTVQPTPALEAGQNISVENGKINALGYNFNGKGFAEIPILIKDAIQEFPYSLEQIGLNDLQLTGDAGATTYTMGGTSVAVITQMGTSEVQGLMMKTANSDIAKISSMDTNNSTITFESTLDANNALSNEVVTNLYVPEVVLISGAAGATTYTYTSNKIPSFSVGDSVSFGDYPLVKVIGIDTSNKTITFDKTLDENDVVSNAQFKYSLKENNSSSGLNSHAEGYETTASGTASHAEGHSTTASAVASHAEGTNAIASGTASHAEGHSTKASGDYSHTEGDVTTASGLDSHAEGRQTIAKNESEHAEGRYNVSHKTSDTYGDAGNTQHTIGIGTGSKSRKNAFEIMQNGDMYVLGIGGYQGRVTKVQNSSIKTIQQVINGNQGITGPQGVQGITGLQGITGKQGIQGVTGAKGLTGDKGPQGVQGITGLQGITGKQGVQGIQGVTGSQGITGKQGIQGVTGAKGLTGDKGPQGVQGIQGVTGSQGVQGIQGVTGKPTTLTAGNNITIQGNTISATDTTYSSGNGISIIDNIISITGYGDNNSITNGTECVANGENSHAEGFGTIADGVNSHTEGIFTQAYNIGEHAQGRYNVSHTRGEQPEGNTIISVGIGVDSDRKNAFEITQNGDIYIYGLGNYNGTEIKSDNNPEIKTLQEILKAIADALGIDIGYLL